MNTLIPLIALIVLFALTMVARVIILHGSAKKSHSRGYRATPPGATVIRVDRTAPAATQAERPEHDRASEPASDAKRDQAG